MTAHQTASNKNFEGIVTTRAKTLHATQAKRGLLENRTVRPFTSPYVGEVNSGRAPLLQVFLDVLNQW
jgi:hypothetical protein